MLLLRLNYGRERTNASLCDLGPVFINGSEHLWPTLYEALSDNSCSIVPTYTWNILTVEYVCIAMKIVFNLWKYHEFCMMVSGDIKLTLFSGSVYWNLFNIFIYPVKIATRSIDLFFKWIRLHIKKAMTFLLEHTKIWINKYMTYLCFEWVNRVELTYLLKFAYGFHHFPLKFQCFLIFFILSIT